MKELSRLSLTIKNNSKEAEDAIKKILEVKKKVKEVSSDTEVSNTSALIALISNTKVNSSVIKDAISASLTEKKKFDLYLEGYNAELRAKDKEEVSKEEFYMHVFPGLSAKEKNGYLYSKNILQ